MPKSMQKVFFFKIISNAAVWYFGPLHFPFYLDCHCTNRTNQLIPHIFIDWPKNSSDCNFLFYVISELDIFFIGTRHIIVLVVYSNYHLVSSNQPNNIQGRIQDFKLGGGALKKIAPSGGRRENFWGISCEKSRFYTKKSYFFQF